MEIATSINFPSAVSHAVSRDEGEPPVTRAPISSSSTSDACSGIQRPMCEPTASSVGVPSSCSAAGFQVVTTPAVVIVRIPSCDELTIAAS